MTRVRATFWALVAVATAALGTLTRALAAPADPATGATVAVSATTLALAVFLAGRIVAALEPPPPKKDP